MSCRLVYMLFMALFCQSLWAQVDLQCRVDSNQMLIGDQRTLWIEARGQSDFVPDSVSFASWGELGFAPLDVQPWQPAGSGAYEQRVVFAVFDTGYIKLPPLKLPYRRGGMMDTAYSNQLSLEVNAVMVDSTGLVPIKPILKEPLTIRDFIPYIIAVSLGLLLIGLIFLRKKAAQKEPEVIEVPVPAHETALQQLAILKKKKLWQQGEIKQYQSELTHIIRAYIEDRFEIRALEMTTGEILGGLKSKELSAELMSDLDQILNMADLIKFAKAQPEVDIHSVFMEKAEQFVIRTKVEETVIVEDSDD